MSNFRDRRTANRVVGPRRIMRNNADKLTGGINGSREREGLFIDFLDQSAVIRSASDASDRVVSQGLSNGDGTLRGVSGLLTYTSPSLKMVTNSAGLLEYAAHNFY